MTFVLTPSLQEKSADAEEIMNMGYEDEVNQDTIDYQEKYHFLLQNLESLIESKTQITKNHVFYDLIMVSELQKILDEVEQR